MRISLKYTFFGVAFGLAFPVVALLMDCCFFNDGDFTLSSMRERVMQNRVHFIIFCAPIVLGATFFMIGRAREKETIFRNRLRHSLEGFKKANEMLDTFTYHVSHDLKSVLNGQISLSKMILKYSEKGDHDKVEEISQKLINSSENGLRTILDFLTISKEGYIDSSILEHLDIHQKLEQIIELNGFNLKANFIFPKKEFTTIRMMEKSFESVLTNLITNSIKYCDKFPEIEISLILENGIKILQYKDNGIGMDLEKDGDKLFRPFVRLSNVDKKEGTGVGLFLVKKIINSYGGDIQVSSEVGKGSTFRIICPEV